MRRLLPISASVILFAASVAHATIVVTGTNVVLSEGGLFGTTDYTLTVYQDAAATDPTSVFFDYNGTKLEVVSWSLDEESDWYVAFAAEVFSAQNIERDQFTAIFTTESPRGPISVGSGNFFLAVSTGQGEDASSEPNRHVFGWVELSNTGEELVALRSAVAYDFPIPGAPANGIIVGTAVAVPEPSSLMLVALGLVALSAFGRRSRSGLLMARSNLATHP